MIITYMTVPKIPKPSVVIFKLEMPVRISISSEVSQPNVVTVFREPVGCNILGEGRVESKYVDKYGHSNNFR